MLSEIKQILTSYITITLIVDLIVWICKSVECEIKETKTHIENKDIKIVLEENSEVPIYDNVDYRTRGLAFPENDKINFQDFALIETFTSRVFINRKRIKTVAFSKFHYFSYISQTLFESFGNYPITEFLSTKLHKVARIHSQQWKDAIGMAEIAVRIDGLQPARDHLFVILSNVDYPVLLGMDYINTIDTPPPDLRAFIMGERTTCV
ncbi:unnamed protein product [Dimorphilus gyrociliatus]|uniref:Uncharacterized protein n=1 Tax=Dimorphilus gyrociliatus TaxID=2664684 RepID=A0A7I8VKU2_9ANNE|nr:unnamed protein product [Dimorphilus gyrociliatus]